MEITRNDDGTLVVPVTAERAQGGEGDERDAEDAAAAPTTKVLHPGEGGYDEALAEWDAQQNPDRETPVSTKSGRQEAMHLIHEVAESPDHRTALDRFVSQSYTSVSERELWNLACPNSRLEASSYKKC